MDFYVFDHFTTLHSSVIEFVVFVSGWHGSRGYLLILCKFFILKDFGVRRVDFGKHLEF